MDTIRNPRVTGRTGGRTAVMTTRPCRAPHQTISDVGVIGGGQIPTPRGGCHGRTTASCASTSGQGSHGMSWRSSTSRTRRVLPEYNLPHVLVLNSLADLAGRLMMARDAGGVQ